MLNVRYLLGFSAEILGKLGKVHDQVKFFEKSNQFTDQQDWKNEICSKFF